MNQTNITSRIQIRQIAGQIALTVGIGLVVYGLAGSGFFSGLVVTKPDFRCADSVAPTAPVQSGADREQIALRLDGTVRDVWRDHRSYQAAGTSTNIHAVRRSLAERKIALVDAMRAAPDAAAAALLSPTERNALQKFAANCLESEVDRRGRLSITYLDDFVGGGADLQQTITTDSGDVYRLHLAHRNAARLTAGAEVRVRGYQIGDDILVDAAPAPAGSTVDGGEITVESMAAAPATVENNRVAIIMAYYSDEAEPVSPTVAGVDSLLNTTINNFYLENSYGKVGFTGDVYGWYQVPIASTDCSYGPVSAAALAAGDPDIDFTQYTHLVIFYRSVGPNCPYAGLAGLNKSLIQTGEGPRYMYNAYVGLATAYVMGHELGHNLGNHHAQYYPCDPPFTDYYYVYYEPGCLPVEYGDIYDIMGGSYASHFNALHKEVSGFFDIGMLETVPAGTHEYVLEPLETATQGLKAVKVLRGIKTINSTKDDYLFIEYRQPLGFDTSFSGFSRDVYNGAVLHVTGAGELYSGLFDPTPNIRNRGTATLPVGSSYTDPMSGIVIETTGQTADALAVTVTNNQTDLTGPVINIVEPSWNQEVSGSMVINITATDPSGIKKVDVHLGSKAGRLLSSMTNAPFVSTIDTTQLPNGATTLVITAYDQSGQAQGLNGNWTTVVRSVVVSNTDAISPAVELTAPASNSTYVSGAVNFAATANDNIGIWKVEFYLDGSATPTLIDTTAPYGGSTNIFFDTTPPIVNTHTITAAAYDQVGNRVDTPVVSFSIITDTTPPTATLVAPAANDVVSGMVQVSITTSDDSGYVHSAALIIDGTYVYLGNPTANFTTWWDSRSIADGSHTIKVRVGDYAGNQFEGPEITITVDNSLPVVSVTSPGPGALASNAIIIAAATHAQGINRVDFYRDGVRLIGSDTVAPYEYTWDTQTVTPGAHTITARAVSTTGTTATSAIVSVTTADYTPPTVSLDSPTDGAAVDGTITLTATAADTPTPSTPVVEFYLDGVTLLGTDSAAPYSIVWDSYTAASGTHTLSARATDANTNYSDSAAVTITVIGPDIVSPAAVMNLQAL